MSEILTSSACMLSWVMARGTPLFICMLSCVMARLCARDWVLVTLSFFGHGLVGFSLLGHGLVRVSLSGHGLGRGHLSLGLDGTISLGGGTICPPDT